MKDKFKEFDTFLLSNVHELMFGDFEMTGDGRERLLNMWYDGFKDRVHDLIESTSEEEEEEPEEKNKDGKKK